MVLYVGIALVSLVVGYSVGASSTPVVGAAIPVVFGLIATAFTLLQRASLNKELAETLKAASTTANFNATKVLGEINQKSKEDARASARQVGWGLIVFTLAYLLGTYLGAWLRISETFSQFLPNAEYVWQLEEFSDDGLTPPPTVPAALEWIQTQRTLQNLGYDSTEVKDLYLIAQNDWSEAQERSPSPFPWEDALAPTNALTALNWLSVQDKLIGRGYTEDQIKALYAIQALERQNVGETPSSDVSPWLDTLTQTPQPASEPLSEAQPGTGPPHIFFFQNCLGEGGSTTGCLSDAFGDDLIAALESELTASVLENPQLHALIEADASSPDASRVVDERLFEQEQLPMFEGLPSVNP